MAKKKDPTIREAPAPSKGRQLQEDRNIPTIKVNVPMPKGAKPPKKGQNTNSSPTQSTKRS